MLSHQISKWRILAEFVVANVFAAYVIVLSSLSPCPPLVNHWIGPILTVASWVILTFMYFRLRCVIATKLERYGERMLSVLSAVTFTGQALGGLIVFLQVNVFLLFTEKQKCVLPSEWCI